MNNFPNENNLEKMPETDPASLFELNQEFKVIPIEDAPSLRDEVTQLCADEVRADINTIYDEASEEENEIEYSESDILEVPEVAPFSEKDKMPRYKVRNATLEDIDDIVNVDLLTFESVYKDYDSYPEELRQELKEKFTGRLEKVGGEWMPLLEREGKVVGFMTCCPTSKKPEDFESWEDTTDNGTLEATYDPKGENVYVVTLSVLPEGSRGKDMLFANQIGKMIKDGYKQGFFESRLPGLRQWMEDHEGIDNPDALSEEVKFQYAKEYFDLREAHKGREVRKDRLIRLYERIGCKPLKVVKDAYQDKPSMNFGVVCVYDGESLFDGSDLPFKIPDNKLTRWALGSVLRLASKSPKVTSKIFG